METKALTLDTRKKLIGDFQRSSQRLILLDYDGTLVPFSERPDRARPGEELIRLLKGLTGDPRNDVVLISGREKDTLSRWFGNLKMGMVAEHGAWIRGTGEEWEMIQDLRSDWKEKIRPILEQWVDRTPGSFIEEKEFSLAWHHRKSDPRLGELRARELVNDLINLTTNLNLQVLEGSKVVEIKNAGINKGRAAMQWISRKNPDFILALGDDFTDEDVFKVLPETAWSVKVRFGPSAARFHLSSPGKVRALLREMIEGLNC